MINEHLAFRYLCGLVSSVLLTDFCSGASKLQDEAVIKSFLDVQQAPLTYCFPLRRFSIVSSFCTLLMLIVQGVVSHASHASGTLTTNNYHHHLLFCFFSVLTHRSQPTTRPGSADRVQMLLCFLLDERFSEGTGTSCLVCAEQKMKSERHLCHDLWRVARSLWEEEETQESAAEARLCPPGLIRLCPPPVPPPGSGAAGTDSRAGSKACTAL